MTSTENTIMIMRERIKRNSVQNNTVTTSVDRIKFFFETLDYTDNVGITVPLKVFFETMGVTPFFRFDYDRFDYGRYGDVGGIDDVVGVNII